MTPTTDPRAERKRAQKERKRAGQALRSVTRSEGFTAATKLFLETRNAAFAPVVEECPDCQALQRRTA